VRVLLAAALLFIGPMEPAHPVEHKLCSGYAACRRAGYSDHGYGRARRHSWWAMGTGSNCTNFVAYRLVREGMPNRRPHPDHGSHTGSLDAYRWGLVYAQHTDRRPQAGAVAWWTRRQKGHYGHVAYVEAVKRDGSLVISEDSATGHGFDWRRIVPGHDWPSGFIHFTLPGQRPVPATRPAHARPERHRAHHRSSGAAGGTVIIAPLDPSGTTVPAGPGHVTIPVQPRRVDPHSRPR
jgi:surface antigen